MRSRRPRLDQPLERFFDALGRACDVNGDVGAVRLQRSQHGRDCRGALGQEEAYAVASLGAEVAQQVGELVARCFELRVCKTLVTHREGDGVWAVTRLPHEVLLKQFHLAAIGYVPINRPRFPSPHCCYPQPRVSQAQDFTSVCWVTCSRTHDELAAPVNILLVAEESAGVRTLRRLADSDDTLVGVLSSGIGACRGASVETAARRLGLSVLPAELVRDPSFADQIRSLETDILLNVHSLHVVVPEILAALRIGSFNLHPGPLPQYAGLAAPSWAIYNGEKQHAVTLHWMEPGIDTGAVAYESSFAIDDQDTGISLSVVCVRHGLPLISRLLEDARRDATSVPAIAQDLSRRRYYHRDPPQRGALVWARPAHEIARFVRACDYSPFASPWGHPRALLGEAEISVIKASPTQRACDMPPGTVGSRGANDAIPVATSDNWLLVHALEVGGVRRWSHEVLEAGIRLHDGV